MTDVFGINDLWILLCAAQVFIMQAGFMCLEAGMTREKNNINVAIKNLCDFGISVGVFWAFGFAVMFGSSEAGFLGSDRFFGGSYLAGATAGDTVFFVFQVMFCGTAVSIISGAVAERLKFNGYLLIALVTAGLIYPIVGHWCWNGIESGQLNGWLGKMGFVDFAGSTVVHSVGGWIALAGVLVIGPRAGRFPEEGNARRFNANNLPLSMAVAGISEWTEDHAQLCARMALEMHEAITLFNHENNTELSLRVGLNSGPVIAGVIGTSRFLYDMWGDTVNVASRMESYGIPGKTQVTEKTFDLLRDFFELEAREPIEIKGKGLMSTFLLLDEKTSSGARDGE